MVLMLIGTALAGGYASVAYTPQRMVLNPAELNTVRGGELEGGVELMDSLRVGLVLRGLRANAPYWEFGPGVVPGDGSWFQAGASVRYAVRFGDSSWGVEPQVALGPARWVSPVDEGYFVEEASEIAGRTTLAATGFFALTGADVTLHTLERASLHLGGRAVTTYTGFLSMGLEGRVGATASF